jgi:hypothetical protein
MVKFAPFLILTAIIEIGVGLLLLLLPGRVLTLLLGIDPGPEAALVGRWLGAALVSIGVASGMARDVRDSAAMRAVLAAVVFYDVAAMLLFVLAATTLNLAGPAIWPAALLHAVLGIWGVLCLRDVR